MRVQADSRGVKLFAQLCSEVLVASLNQKKSAGPRTTALRVLATYSDIFQNSNRIFKITLCGFQDQLAFNKQDMSTSWASQDQIEIAERASRRQFEELDAEDLTQHFYDQSRGDHRP